MRRWIWIIPAVVFVIDQFTKWLVKENMELYEEISVIGHFFQITSHRNKGAAFGILQDQRWFFVIVTIAILCILVWYLLKLTREGQKWFSVALAFILGGAVGNFVDRLFYGEVVDFFQFHFQFNFFGKAIDYIYPIFNVADSMIVVGVIMIFIDAWVTWRRERKAQI